MRVRQRKLLHKIPGENGFVHVADIAVRFSDVGVIVGARKPATPDKIIEGVVDVVLLAKVSAILVESEGQDVHLSVAPREQGCQVGAQQKRVGSREIDIPTSARMDAVDCLLKAVTQLHLINEESVCDTSFAAVLYLFFIPP